MESHPGGEFGLSLDRILRLIEEVHEQFGPVFLVVSGGEALTRRKDCLTILQHASQLLRVRLITNGTLIDPVTAQCLKELDIDIKVSLDGSAPESHDWMRGEGSFDRTMAGLQNLFAAGYPPSRLRIGVTIPPERLHLIDEMIALAVRLGVGAIRFDAVSKIGRARVNWPRTKPMTEADSDSGPLRRYFEETFPARYGSDWNMIDMDANVPPFETIHVYPDGSVYPFTPYNHPGEYESCLGNINESTLKGLLEGQALSRIVLRKFLRFSMGPASGSKSIYLYRCSLADAENQYPATIDAIR